MRQVSPTRIHVFYALLIMALVTGCAETRQAKSLDQRTQSGFLGDYSKLSKGTGDQTLLRYVKPGVDFRQYQKAMIDPVTIWSGEGSDLAALPASERQKLADRFHAHLVKEVSAVLPVTTTPQPGVMRIQVALTDAEKSRAALDTISTVMPVGLAASAVSEAFTGKASFTGTTGMEIRVSDAYTREVLAAAVDERVGSKSLGRGTFSKWGDTDAAMRYWSQLLAYRICQYRGQKGCTQPKG